MIRPMTLAMLLIVAASPAAHGQDQKAKGFKLAPKGEQSKSVEKTPAVVIGGDEKIRTVKIWEINKMGEPSRKFKDCSAGVEKIELLSNQTMRWTFVVANRGNDSQDVFMDMKTTYVADADGETFEPIGREFEDNDKGAYRKEMKAGTKFRFWLEFPAPKRATKLFTVGIRQSMGYYVPLDSFLPFKLPLKEAIGGDGVAEEAETPETPPVKNPPAGTGPGAMTRGTARPADPKADALRAASREGRRFEGSVRDKDGTITTGILLFEKRAADRLISAKLTRSGGTSKAVKLLGAVFEDEDAPGGMAFRLEGPDDVTYTFSLDKTMLTGTDSKGYRYNFVMKK